MQPKPLPARAKPASTLLLLFTTRAVHPSIAWRAPGPSTGQPTAPRCPCTGPWSSGASRSLCVPRHSSRPGGPRCHSCAASHPLICCAGPFGEVGAGPVDGGLSGGLRHTAAGVGHRPGDCPLTPDLKAASASDPDILAAGAGTSGDGGTGGGGWPAPLLHADLPYRDGDHLLQGFVVWPQLQGCAL
jgi:hypothetical protein